MEFADNAEPAASRQAQKFHSVLEFVRKQGVLRQRETVVVGISGGADSTALALILWAFRSPNLLGLKLHLAHFDHKLRTEEEASADLAFVRELACRLRLPLATGSADVRAHARTKHLSLEDAARRLRYAFLAEQASAAAATSVAVGHTRDDQAETVLLHLIRGAGMRGLRGMLPRSDWPFGAGPDLARPILTLSRDETQAYCEEAGLTPRHDPTNLSLKAARNRVRLQVLPAMRAINPRVGDAILRLASSVVSDLEFLDRAAAVAWNSLAVESDGQVRLPREELGDLDPALAARVLMRAVAHLGATDTALAAEHIDRVQALLHSRRNRWSLSLPGGLRISVRGTYLRVTVGDSPRAPGIPPTALRMEGVTEAGNWRFRVKLVKRPSALAVAQSEAYLRPPSVGEKWIVRSRLPGDRLRPFGVRGTKKLKDILIDARVPEDARDNIPLICDESGILWVVEHRIAERAAVRDEDETVLHITARPI